MFTYMNFYETYGFYLQFTYAKKNILLDQINCNKVKKYISRFMLINI